MKTTDTNTSTLHKYCTLLLLSTLNQNPSILCRSFQSIICILLSIASLCMAIYIDKTADIHTDPSSGKLTRIFEWLYAPCMPRAALRPFQKYTQRHILLGKIRFSVVVVFEPVYSEFSLRAQHIWATDVPGRALMRPLDCIRLIERMKIYCLLGVAASHERNCTHSFVCVCVCFVCGMNEFAFRD